MRDKCREVAARMNKEMPPTKDELEVIARRTLEEMGLAEGYVGWVMVMISTEFFRDAVAGLRMCPRANIPRCELSNG